jgi:hypothetical protein
MINEEFKITILGPYEILNDEFIDNMDTHSYNAKVLTMKSSIFVIKKEQLVKILKENKDINEYLKLKCITK